MGKKFSLADIKVFYDQQGQPYEVLMSYELFRQMETMLWELLSEDEIGNLLDEVWEDQPTDGSGNRQSGSKNERGKIDVNNLLEWLDK